MPKYSDDPVFKKVVTLAFNVKVRIDRENRYGFLYSLRRIVEDPQSISDEPLWKIKRK